MQARYSSTRKLRNIAKDVQKQRLKCGVEYFSELLGRSKSWCCNFLNGAVEVKGLYPEDLKRLFTIEYNCVLFENKKEQQDLIDHAVENSVINTGIVPGEGSKILTLSTCIGASVKSDTRWVVQAVRVEL